MNELELKKFWQSTNDKMDENLSISRKNMDDITRMKIYGFLGSMKPIKIFTLLVGLLWVGIGATVLSQIYIHAFAGANKFFLFSATLQILLTVMALIIYIYQLIKIYQVEISDPILQTQEKLAQLKISTLWSARIMFLQLPVWTTFWWNGTMFAEWNLLQWAITIMVTSSFTYVALWLFFNIKYENRNTKWFNLIFNGDEWTPLMKSMGLLEQVQDFRVK